MQRSESTVPNSANLGTPTPYKRSAQLRQEASEMPPSDAYATLILASELAALRELLYERLPKPGDTLNVEVKTHGGSDGE